MLVLGKMIVTQYIKSYVAFPSTMIYQVENDNSFKTKSSLSGLMKSTCANIRIWHVMASRVHEDRRCKFALTFEADQIFLMKGKRDGGRWKKYAWKALEKGVCVSARKNSIET